MEIRASQHAWLPTLLRRIRSAARNFTGNVRDGHGSIPSPGCRKPFVELKSSTCWSCAPYPTAGLYLGTQEWHVFLPAAQLRRWTAPARIQPLSPVGRAIVQPVFRSKMTTRGCTSSRRAGLSPTDVQEHQGGTGARAAQDICARSILGWSPDTAPSPSALKPHKNQAKFDLHLPGRRKTIPKLAHYYGCRGRAGGRPEFASRSPIPTTPICP